MLILNVGSNKEMILDLSTLGFHPQGQSWLLNIEGNQVAVIAIGGKFSQPGALCRTICLRHRLMRTREEIVPTGFVKDPFDYPVKMSVEEVSLFDPKRWRYESRLLNYPMSYLRTQQECDRLSAAIASRLIPWARQLTVAKLRSEIVQCGQNGWIEKMWIEDLASNHGSQAIACPADGSGSA